MCINLVWILYLVFEIRSVENLLKMSNINPRNENVFHFYVVHSDVVNLRKKIIKSIFFILHSIFYLCLTLTFCINLKIYLQICIDINILNIYWKIYSDIRGNALLRPWEFCRFFIPHIPYIADCTVRNRFLFCNSYCFEIEFRAYFYFEML